MSGRRVRRIKIPLLNNVATAIGYTSIFWGWLDSELAELIEVLSPLESGDVSQSIVTHIDMREKIKILRALGFIRKPSVEWFSDLKTTLDIIDDDLRNRRNRVTHDIWTGTHDTILRRTRHAKVIRPQARQQVLSTVQEVSVKATEVWKLSNEIVLARMQIFSLCGNYLALKRGEPAPFSTKLLQQYPRQAPHGPHREHARSIRKRSRGSSPI
jgi:hypothetical protein